MWEIGSFARSLVPHSPHYALLQQAEELGSRLGSQPPTDVLFPRAAVPKSSQLTCLGQAQSHRHPWPQLRPCRLYPPPSLRSSLGPGCHTARGLRSKGRGLEGMCVKDADRHRRRGGGMERGRDYGVAKTKQTPIPKLSTPCVASAFGALIRQGYVLPLWFLRDSRRVSSCGTVGYLSRLQIITTLPILVSFMLYLPVLALIICGKTSTNHFKRVRDRFWQLVMIVCVDIPATPTPP